MNDSIINNKLTNIIYDLKMIGNSYYNGLNVLDENDIETIVQIRKLLKTINWKVKEKSPDKTLK